MDEVEGKLVVRGKGVFKLDGVEYKAGQEIPPEVYTKVCKDRKSVLESRLMDQIGHRLEVVDPEKPKPKLAEPKRDFGGAFEVRSGSRLETPPADDAN